MDSYKADDVPEDPRRRQFDPNYNKFAKYNYDSHESYES